MQGSQISVFDENNCKDDDSCYSIISMEKVSERGYKIALSVGPSFFIKEYYLQNIKIENLCCGQTYSKYQINDMMNAATCYLIERQAFLYLNRCEQSRMGLFSKLVKKGYDTDSINQVFDYLEYSEFLSDYRFALSWLRNRRISVSEGRNKLLNMLLAKGISSKIAQQVLDEFFEEFPERELLQKAYNKCIRMNITQEKIMKRLNYLGFSHKMIKEIMDNNSCSV